MKETTEKNGYVKWSILWKVLAGMITLAGWVYGIRANAISDQFDAQDKKIDSTISSLNEHIKIQNANELKIAESLGQIKTALKISDKIQ